MSATPPTPPPRKLRPADIFVLTERGQEQLRGASTTLPAEALEILVLIDGFKPLVEISAVLKALPPVKVFAYVERMLTHGMIEPAPRRDDKDLDFSSFFGTMPKASSGATAAAEREAESGTPTLKRYGFYVSIARRAAQARVLGAEEKLVVLVVEDDEDIARLLLQLLDIEGYSTRLATCREEILLELRNEPPPDIVLLDVVLPDANGLQVLASMKRHAKFKSIPVIMLTAQANQQSVSEGLAAGADGYITKPFDLATLLRGMRAVLGLPEPAED